MSAADEPHDKPDCTVRFDLIREQEKCADLEAFVVWISSYPNCPYGVSASALLQKWAKQEAKP